MLTLQSEPLATVVTRDDAKLQATIDFADDDALIDGIIAAASDYYEARNGILGRALVTQTWKLTLPSAPSGDKLHLPYPPVQSVASVTYQSGGEQTFAAENYRLIGDDSGAFIELVDGASWPSTERRSDALSVTFVAGYGDTGADVPERIRHSVRLLAAYWYTHRDAAEADAPKDIAMGVQSLALPMRVAGGFF